MSIQAKFDLVVIGGGAAGFFGAIQAASHHRGAKVLILERSAKLLSKVRVSGGGRCNLTNSIPDIKTFSRMYPRGDKHMFRLLHKFSQKDTVAWFEQRGVKLKAEPDGRMFPISDSSETIIQCLMEAASELGIRISTNEGIEQIETINEGGFRLFTSRQQIEASTVLIASGGHPKAEGFSWLQKLGFAIEQPVPSLFTFNIPRHELKPLMGLSANVRIRIEGTKLEETGPMLITHWGFSGPAVLRCSAWGSRELAERNYSFAIRIHWLPELSQDEIRDWLEKQRHSNGKRSVTNRVFESLPQRLWEALCIRAGIDTNTKWATLSAALFNKLVDTLSSDRHEVSGKTTFKEEFVTCGGISLKEIDNNCMSRRIPGIFFAGEVLDVDGITGGFNFQHAWSSGYTAGTSAALWLNNR